MLFLYLFINMFADPYSTILFCPLTETNCISTGVCYIENKFRWFFFECTCFHTKNYFHRFFLRDAEKMYFSMKNIIKMMGTREHLHKWDERLFGYLTKQRFWNVNLMNIQIHELKSFFLWFSLIFFFREHFDENEKFALLFTWQRNRLFFVMEMASKHRSSLTFTLLLIWLDVKLNGVLS